jgi:hypothetical protein
MKKSSAINLIVAGIAMSPLAYLAIRWKSIPAVFPIRFDLGRGFESMESRTALLVSCIIFSLASIGINWILRNLQKVDPKVTEETPKSSFNRLGMVVAFFLTTLNLFFILTAQNAWTVRANVVFGFFGMLVAILGNYFYSLKPNHVAGIRLPWTLNDPDNWRKTHQLTGKIWVAGGLSLILASILVPVSLLLVIIVTIVVVLIMMPIVYSYKLHRTKGTA